MQAFNQLSMLQARRLDLLFADEDQTWGGGQPSDVYPMPRPGTGDVNRLLGRNRPCVMLRSNVTTWHYLLQSHSNGSTGTAVPTTYL